MARTIVLCGARSDVKAKLVASWVNKHKKFKLVPVIIHSITQESIRDCLEECNKQELKLVEGASFISEGGIDLLVHAHRYTGQRLSDHTAQTPPARACLQRYRSTESLVVVVESPRPGSEDSIARQFNWLTCELLRKYFIPHVLISESDPQEFVCNLEQALKGMFPFNADSFTRYPLNIPFVIAEHPQEHRLVALRRMEISPHSIKLSFSPFSRGETNRMVDRYGKESFVLLDFHKEVPANVVERILCQGVWVNGEEFQFLGCSSSGLKTRTCYMLRGNIGDVQAVLKECGDFSAIPSVSKRLSRIGLLFSAVRPTNVEVLDDEVVEIEDIETPAGNFTDGCGGISMELARRVVEGAKLANELGLPEHGQYIPSVFQIRYQGCKGVVTIDPGHGRKLVIRKSMKKFKQGVKPLREVWLCGFSRPYSYGHLNRQFIMLLSGLGIKDEAFLQLQHEHLRRLETMTADPEVAVEMLLWNNQPEVATKVAICSPGKFKDDKRIQEVLSHLQCNLISKLGKLRLLVVRSRNVYGVCDPVGVLNYGQCYFRPTIQGKPKTLSGRVTVAKNPCYLLGDIRVLTAVDVHGLEHLVDCVVFPVQGKRPHPMEIAGSDLDGDQYFVCWDPNFIPPLESLRNPYDYPAVEAPLSSAITRDKLISYFSKQNMQSNVMGKIDHLFKYWADMKGVGCPECEELGMLFSRSVDSAKTGDRLCIPRHLQQPKHSLQSAESSGHTVHQCDTKVWKRMNCIAEQKRRELSEDVTASLLSMDTSPTVSEKFVWSLILNEELNMSAFNLFQFVQRWCNGQVHPEEESHDKLLEFSDHINFGEFTTDQQKAAIDAGIPVSLVTNALNKSKLLAAELLESFSLNSEHCGWRFYFRSLNVQLDWQHLLRAILRHPESIVVIELPAGIKFALHFLSQIKPGSTDLNSGSVVTYFFSQHFRLKHRHVLGPQYNIDVENDTIQLYRGEHRRTFIWFSNEEDGAKISVDLSRFDSNIYRKANHPKVRKDSLRSVEVFVKKFDHEPAYLDSYTPYQPDDIYPDDFEDHSVEEEVEELPVDEIQADNEATLVLDADTPDAALSLLKDSACKGNCHHYLKVLQLILSMETQTIPPFAIQESLLTLLETMLSRFAHNTLATLEDCLQVTVTTVHHHFPIQSPMVFLKVLKGISWLHCYNLAEQVRSPLAIKLQVSQFADYLELVSHWENWCGLSPNLAIDIACELHALYVSFLSVETQSQRLSTHEIPDVDHTLEDDVIKTELKSLRELACSGDSAAVSPVDQSQVQQYCLYFGHLLLQHFLAEAEEIQKRALSTFSTAEFSLTMLKAYDFNDPHYVSQADSTPSSDGNDSKEVYSKGIWRVGFHRSKAINSKRFTEGTYIAIHLMTRSESSRASSHPVALGCLVQVSSPPTNIIVDVLPPTPQCLKKSVQLGKGHWELRLVGNVTTFKRATQALYKLLDNGTKLQQLLVHPDAFPPRVTSTPGDVSSSHDLSSAASACKPAFNSEIVIAVPSIVQEPDTLADSDRFNASQKQAIKAALTQRLTLIHGPPGTGKTYVACEIVCCQLAQSKECSVLVTAETNMAVDNLTRQLLQLNLRVVRIGNRGHIAPDVRHVSLEHQVQMKQNELGKKERESRFLDSRLAKQVLRGAQVVATTCSGAGDLILKGMCFPFVLVDEATQVTEPVSLLPIVHQSQQIVLIGDPEQLAPTVPFPVVPQQSLLAHEPSADSMAITLFHRLHKVLPSFFLKEQHRMHPGLAEFPSQAFYNGKLKSALSTTVRPPLNVPWLDKERPLLFINTSRRCERKIGTSFQNDFEAELVVDVVRSLLSYELSPLEIVVLSPYTGQVQCIRQKLSVVANKVEVCTVDSFQGREKEVVIFCTVCNNPDRLDFVGNRNRMNVLLTRMKRGLVGVGSEDTLRGHQLWAKWLNQTCVIDERKFRVTLDFKGSRETSAQGKGARASKMKRDSGSRPTSRGPGYQGDRNQSQWGHSVESQRCTNTSKVDKAKKEQCHLERRPSPIGSLRTPYSRTRQQQLHGQGEARPQFRHQRQHQKGYKSRQTKSVSTADQTKGKFSDHGQDCDGDHVSKQAAPMQGRRWVQDENHGSGAPSLREQGGTDRHRQRTRQRRHYDRREQSSSLESQHHMDTTSQRQEKY